MIGRVLLVVAGMVVGVVAAPPARSQVIRATGKLSTNAANPECPHTWRIPEPVRRPVPDSGFRSIPMGADEDPTRATEFAVPRGTTNVPEFHDCQRLLVPVGQQTQYGPLAAVFANPDTTRLRSETSPRIAALIYLPQGGRYRELGLVDRYGDPLGPVDRFGCLVIQRLGASARAWMMPVAKDTDCTVATYSAATAAGSTALRPLVVRMVPPAPGTTVPVVARWDVDPRTGLNNIGVWCGGMWCEVGPPGFRSAARHAVRDGILSYTVRGLYDQQPLAEFRGGALIVGRSTGAVMPLPGVRDLARTAPALGIWVEAARVHVWPQVSTYYQAEMNFTASAPGDDSARPAVVSLCRTDGTTRCAPDGGGTLDVSECTKGADGMTWVARSTRPGKDPLYSCVLYRRHHDLIEVPPTVRWRWRVNDETIWIACPNGCCEVKARR